MKVLFVCSGNTDRSPIAECVVRRMLEEAGLCVEVDSAGLNARTGAALSPDAARVLSAHGLGAFRHTARRCDPLADYAAFDAIYCMTESQARRMSAACGGDPEGKIRMLREHSIGDPWETGEYETAFQDIASGCEALVMRLKERKTI